MEATEHLNVSKDDYKSRYKEHYKCFISDCFKYRKGMITREYVELQRGHLLESCYVLIGILGLSSKEVRALEKEVELDNGWIGINPEAILNSIN